MTALALFTHIKAINLTICIYIIHTFNVLFTICPLFKCIEQVHSCQERAKQQKRNQIMDKCEQ